MNARDRDWLKVLHEVKKGHLTQAEAGEQLGASGRWVRKLMRRMRTEGDEGILHRLRGRRSNRKIEEKTQREAVRRVKGKYADFGPTLAAEYLAEREGIRVSKETLRKWMMEAGVWQSRARRVESVHGWRPRRSCWGELVQWDTSEHEWLEGRGEKLYLIAMIDDATSRLMGQFAKHDSTEENLRALKSYVKRWGRPVAFYTDKASLFRVNRAANVEEQLEGEEARTQIGRALRELGIEWIGAHSPQAKGRVERCFGTLQDRLVKGLRVAGACSLEQANDYLQGEFLPDWEKRFTVKARQVTDAHRRLGHEHDLEAILCPVESRVVANDYTLRFQGQSYQVDRRSIRAGLRGARVRVEQRLDGTLAVRFRDRYLTTARCEVRTGVLPVPRSVRAKNPVKAKTRSRWMEGFDLQSSPPLWKAVSQEAGLARDP
ncbi:MAG TPA: ISNCY family transposase [Terriglobales bacterium]|nr:ISNCY family transposase [Terriglobales bacterium]